MRRYLVLANRTLGGEQLLDEIRRRVQAGPASFYLVVPAHPSREIAGILLLEAIKRFRDLGVEVAGEVGDPHPVAAVYDALKGRTVDEVIVSTLPAGASRWFQNDTPSKIERVFSIPVTHIISNAT